MLAETLKELATQATTVTPETVAAMFDNVAKLRANRDRQEAVFKELEHALVHELDKQGLCRKEQMLYLPINKYKVCETCTQWFSHGQWRLEFKGRYWHAGRCGP